MLAVNNTSYHYSMKLAVLLSAWTVVTVGPNPTPALSFNANRVAALLDPRACCTCSNGDSGCGGWCYTHCPSCISTSSCSQWIP